MGLPRRLGVPNGIILKGEIIEVVIHVLHGAVFVEERRLLNWVASITRPAPPEDSSISSIDELVGRN